MKYVLCLIVLLISLTTLSCSKFDFNNPVDPSFELGSPGELTYGSFTESSIELKWNYLSKDITDIEIEQSTDNVKFTCILTVKSNVRSIIVAGSFLSSNTYYFRIRGRADNNFSAYSHILPVKLVLNAPYNLTITSFTETAVSLQWQNNAQGLNAFEIEMSNDSIAYSVVKTIPASSGSASAPAFSAVIEGEFLSAGKYYFRVRGKTGLNTTSYSNTVSARLQFDAPTDLSVVSLSETNVVLRWLDNSSFETGFDIEFSSDGLNYKVIASAPANSSFISLDWSFAVNKTYYFRIKAKSDVNTSAYSNTVSVPLLFDAPSGLSVSGISETSVKLMWQDNSSFESGFEIEKTTPSGVSSQLIQVSANQNYYTDNSLVKTNTYSYRVKAYTPKTSSAYSPAIKISYSTSSQTLARTLIGHSEEVRSVCFSPDGLTLASGSKDNTVKLWSVNDGSQIRTLLGHQSRVYSVNFSPDGQYIASGSADSTVKIWKSADGALVNTLRGFAGSVTSVAFSRDGLLVAGGSFDNTIIIWNMKDASKAMTLTGHAGPVNSLCYSQDGLYLASGSDDNTIKIWNANTGSLLRTIQNINSLVNSVAFSHDGQYLVCGTGDNSVITWKVSDFSQIRKLSATSNVFSVALSPDGQFVSGGIRDNTVQIWKTSDGSLVYTLKGHSGSVWSVNFSPDGQFVASGSTDAFIKIWRVGSGWIIVP